MANNSKSRRSAIKIRMDNNGFFGADMDNITPRGEIIFFLCYNITSKTGKNRKINPLHVWSTYYKWLQKGEWSWVAPREQVTCLHIRYKYVLELDYHAIGKVAGILHHALFLLLSVESVLISVRITATEKTLTKRSAPGL